MKQGAFKTIKVRPFAAVAAHVLLLLAKTLQLIAYAPTCMALIDPPYEIDPKDVLELFAKELALQLEQDVLWTLTARLLAFDASHVLLLLAFELKLHAYAPMCRALSDPPNDFAPNEMLELVVKAMQLEHGVSLTRTLKPLAVVAAQVLLLLLADELSLHAYAPTCRALSDPPNDLSDPPNHLAPRESLELIVEAMQLEHGVLLTTTFRPVAIVASHLLILLAKLAAEAL